MDSLTTKGFDQKHGSCAGADKMDIRWILDEAATDCGRCGCMPADPVWDPGYVIDAARMVEPSSIVKSNFMEAYSSSLRTYMIAGIEVRPGGE